MSTSSREIQFRGEADGGGRLARGSFWPEQVDGGALDGRYKPQPIRSKSVCCPDWKARSSPAGKCQRSHTPFGLMVTKLSTYTPMCMRFVYDARCLT